MIGSVKALRSLGRLIAGPTVPVAGRRRVGGELPLSRILETAGVREIPQDRAPGQTQRMAGRYIRSVYSLTMRSMLNAGIVERIDSFITWTHRLGIPETPRS